MKLQGVALLAACLTLPGCGELSYKRGAGQDSLNAARQHCQEQGNDRAAYEECMGDNGWMVQRLDKLELDPVATIAPSADNRSSAANEATAAVESGQTKPADPLDKFTIGSWWKFGGNPDGLKTAMSGCISSLGEAHRPAPGGKEFTRGLLLCLREQGWHGVQEK